MMPLHHGLVATDLSPASLHGLDRALEIARATAARCTVMTALGLEPGAPLQDLLGVDASGTLGRFVEQQRAVLTTLVAKQSGEMAPAPEIRVETGLAADVIPAFAESDGVDLIVIGFRGRGALRRLVLGSTASHLLRKSHHPVLIVKSAAEAPYRRVLVPVDFSPASESALRMARIVARGADLLLLHVVDVPFEGLLSYAGVPEEQIESYRIEARRKALREMHALATRAGLVTGDYTTRVIVGEPSLQVLDQANLEARDLVVMGKHGTHVTEELLLGSVTKRVLDQTAADMLVVVDERPPPSPGYGTGRSA